MMKFVGQEYRNRRTIFGFHVSAPAACEEGDSKHTSYGVHFPPPGKVAAIAVQSAAGKHIPTASARGCEAGSTVYVKHNRPLTPVREQDLLTPQSCDVLGRQIPTGWIGERP